MTGSTLTGITFRAIRPRLLCYGHDETLLITRRLILEQHYEVETCSRIEALDAILERGPVEIAVLCHTVPDAECQQVMDAVRAHVPGAKILVLVESHPTDCAEHSDRALESLAGPPALLRQVESLLSSQA